MKEEEKGRRWNIKKNTGLQNAGRCASPQTRVYYTILLNDSQSVIEVNSFDLIGFKFVVLALTQLLALRSRSRRLLILSPISLVVSLVNVVSLCEAVSARRLLASIYSLTLIPVVFFLACAADFCCAPPPNAAVEVVLFALVFSLFFNRKSFRILCNRLSSSSSSSSTSTFPMLRLLNCFVGIVCIVFSLLVEFPPRVKEWGD